MEPKKQRKRDVAFPQFEPDDFGNEANVNPRQNRPPAKPVTGNAPAPAKPVTGNAPVEDNSTKRLFSDIDTATQPYRKAFWDGVSIHDAPNRAVWGGLNSAINKARGRKSTLDKWNDNPKSNKSTYEWATDPNSGAYASDLIADQVNYPKNDPTKWELTDIPRIAAYPLDMVTDVNYLVSLGLAGTGAGAPAGAALATSATAKHLNRIRKAMAPVKWWADHDPSSLVINKLALPAYRGLRGIGKKPDLSSSPKKSPFDVTRFAEDSGITEPSESFQDYLTRIQKQPGPRLFDKDPDPIDPLLPPHTDSVHFHPSEPFEDYVARQKKRTEQKDLDFWLGDPGSLDPFRPSSEQQISLTAKEIRLLNKWRNKK